MLKGQATSPMWSCWGKVTLTLQSPSEVSARTYQSAKHLVTLTPEHCTGKTLTTKYIDNSLDPRWNETLEFPLKKPLTASDLLGVQVFDYELIGQDRRVQL